MKFIYLYPELSGSKGDLLDAGPIASVAAVAEREGWHGFALTEHPAPSARWLESGGHQTLDPFIALGHAAAVTHELRLLTYLSVAAYRNPLLLAKSAATLDRLSEGRFILGVGAGYQKSEFHALGAPFTERGALLDEALAVLPLHWSGEPFSFKGKHFDARNVIARPGPHGLRIPIWVGGNADAVLRRVADHGDGWMPLLAPAEHLRATKADGLNGIEELALKIGDVRAMAGVRGADLSIVVSYDCVDPDDPTNDAARHRRYFAALAGVGVTHVIISATSRRFESTTSFLEGFGRSYFRQG